MMTDFPKIQCPFVRKLYRFRGDPKDYPKYHIRPGQKTLYLVTNEIKESMGWVFEDPDTIATEKLDGTNFKVKIENNRITEVQNRQNVIDLLAIVHGRQHFAEGVLNSVGRGYIHGDGEHVGELIGPKIQGNPYDLAVHELYPFEKAIEELRYKSFDKHEKNYTNFDSWFKDYLKSLLYAKRHKIDIKDAKFAEGVVFHNLKLKAQGKTGMAKLRRDMYRWWYDKFEIDTDPVEMTIEDAKKIDEEQT
jgi:hypothetical protein